MRRAAPIRRTEKPLRPNRSVNYVKGAAFLVLSPHEITPDTVGLKAWGLASIPSAWTTPFFVICGGDTPTTEALEQALAQIELFADDEVYVRSSGISESLDARGSLVSSQCTANQLLPKLEQMKAACRVEGSATETVHWVIQALIKVETKGHLSNERRVAEDKRDWVAETEASIGRISEWNRISIRPWRDNREPSEEIPLQCIYRETYVDRLKEVARWAYERLIRVHFEWVWDGKTIYVVQADECDSLGHGIDPKSLVKLSSDAEIAQDQLKAFRVAEPSDFSAYRKLANAKLYQDLGYTMVPFFVLDDPTELQLIFNEGKCSESVLQDLELLTKRPLVIRTDGSDIPDGRRTMLPRSDELRSSQAACQWLINSFRTPMVSTNDRERPLAQYKLCLIAHHFVPAVASAWCQARPDSRRVRIESLWGIPEGLYWYGYDAFDVDTKNLSLKKGRGVPVNMTIRERLRYKEHFIAPDDTGAWVVHKSAVGPDWNRSIKHKKWIEEISLTSRRIAQERGEPVVVMWFVDIPQGASKHKVLPWYHEEWRLKGALHKAAPRKKNPSSSDYLLQTRSDWVRLKSALEATQSISRVVVHPTEPELVRDQDFATELASLGKKYRFVIELAGGILSHAYYMLSSAGCDVECVDLDDCATGDDELNFNKLVRDKIPDSIAAKGESVLLMQLQGDALIAALRRKLVEESLEVLDAKNNDQIAEELADVREVMLALMHRLEITEASVERLRRKKAGDRGAFEKALMLSRTAISSPIAMQGMEPDEFGAGDTQPIAKTISRVIELPTTTEDLHSDRRVSSGGGVERLFTTELPTHADGLNPLQTRFLLEIPGTEPQEMLFEVQAERVGADLYLKMKLGHAPTQLKLFE